MSHTFTRKVHRGEIQKQINEEDRKKQESIQQELLEEQKWSDGPKVVTKHEQKTIKEEEKQKKKEHLKELYEKEMEGI